MTQTQTTSDRREITAPILDGWDSADIATLTELMSRLEHTVCRQLESELVPTDHASTNEGQA